MAGLASPADYEWSWATYTPTPPPKVIQAAVTIEVTDMRSGGGLSNDFFIPMQNHAVADLSNLFTQIIPPGQSGADYLIRLSFTWDGESQPSADIIDARSGNLLASLTRAPPRLLRPVALNLRDAMALLKADIALTIERSPPAPTEPRPPHHDPL
ncbi:MAG: hypothetical protein Q7R40_19335 [Phaeospirillum sp.]|nr:hypothetical protein [Phaeospirillum sp.]